MNPAGLLYDSDIAGAIPPGATKVCLYGDRWTPNLRVYLPLRPSFDAWPGCSAIIAYRGPVTGPPAYPGGGVGWDCETGAVGIATLPGLVADQREKYPTSAPFVYLSLTNWTSARLALRNAGVAYPDWWIAWYQSTPPVATPPPSISGLPTASGWQYCDTRGSGGHYDLSVTIPSWPPPPTEEDTVQPLYIAAGHVSSGVTANEGQFLISGPPWVKLAIAAGEIPVWEAPPFGATAGPWSVAQVDLIPLAPGVYPASS